jgi:putative membrane protein
MKTTQDFSEAARSGMAAHQPCLLRGLVAGAAAGLAATFVMSQFQAGWSAASEHMRRDSNGAGKAKSSGNGEEPATVKAAEAITKKVAGHKLPENKKEMAGSIVHYAFGTANGVLYGVLSEYVPQARFGYGTLFGIGLWAAADEIAVPAFGLAKLPTENPPEEHLRGLASHLVYGLATDVVASGVRRLMTKAA